MGSTVQKVPAAKPSASKFVDYKGVNKLPMQGGACTPEIRFALNCSSLWEEQEL